MSFQMTEHAMASALRLIAATLERLGIPYVVGGSLASSCRGMARFTMDIDIVAQIEPGQAERLSAVLGPDWYADAAQIGDAISAGRAFNLIHIPTSFKVDVFPAIGEFELSQLKRGTQETLEVLGETGVYPVATAEDILLAKLQWFRDGGETSDREWADITGIVALNPGLDRAYVEAWATQLGVRELLTKALADGGRQE